MWILPLSEVGRGDIDRAGGKGANLGELLRLGMPVPPGFVVTAQAYSRQAAAWEVAVHLAPFLGQTASGAPTDDLAPVALARTPPTPTAPGETQPGHSDREALSRAAADVIGQRPLDPSLEEAIRHAYRAMGAPPVAVRSSATAEDLADASFAGQQETFLNVRGEEAVLEAVRRCWASLWTPRAIDYRERRGIDHLQVAMAVVVQEMVPAEAAGVLFTVDPVSRRSDRMLVEAAPGMGEAVVSGSVTGETCRVVRGPMPSAGRGPTPSMSRGEPTPAPSMGRDGPTPALSVEREVRRPGPPVLPDEQVLEVARLALRLEEHFGCPQDVEFAVARGQVWLLQARPITTLTAAKPEPLPPPPRLDWLQRLFLPVGQERYPIAPRPLDNLIFAEVADGITNAVMASGFAVAPGALEELKRQVWRQVYASFPRTRPTLRLLGGRRYVLELLRKDWTGWWEREAGPQMTALGRLCDDLTDLPDEELLRRVDEIHRVMTPILRERMRYPSADTARVWLKALLLLAMGPRQAQAVFDDLFTGLPTRTTETNRALWTLSREARQDPQVAAAIAAGQPEALARFPAGQAFLRRFEAFLERYGHREGVTFYLSTPTWRQDPSQVWQLLRGLMAVETPPPEGSERYEAALRRVLDGLWWLPFLRRPARWLVERLRMLQRLREDSHFDMSRVVAALEALAHEWGRRLTDRGLLTQPEDIFYLTFDEVRAWLLGSALPPEEARRHIARRRATYDVVNARWQASMFRAIKGGGRSVRGVPASAGVVRGPARIIRSEADWHKLQPGDVMVCPYTNPSWTPLFAIAAAVVAETGGAGAHAAIVAREYRIPAVMGVPGATSRIPDGQEVLVDGSTGRVDLGH